jgi:hypothetical protein
MPRGPEGKGTVEASVGRQGSKGSFGIEEAAEAGARRTKLAQRAERSAASERGDGGGRRQCPRCGQGQKEKGEVGRELVFDCGPLTVARAYDVCGACGQTSYPVDEP